MVIIYQLNIKYGYVSQACMLILHRVESNKTAQGACFLGPAGINRRKLS